MAEDLKKMSISTAMVESRDSKMRWLVLQAEFGEVPLVTDHEKVIKCSDQSGSKSTTAFSSILIPQLKAVGNAARSIGKAWTWPVYLRLSPQIERDIVISYDQRDGHSPAHPMANAFPRSRRPATCSASSGRRCWRFILTRRNKSMM
jgi:hypothetical protein